MIFLVQFLTTRDAVVLLSNDPSISATLMRSFKQLEHQNPSIILEDIGRAMIVQ